MVLGGLKRKGGVIVGVGEGGLLGGGGRGVGGGGEDWGMWGGGKFMVGWLVGGERVDKAWMAYWSEGMGRWAQRRLNKVL